MAPEVVPPLLPVRIEMWAFDGGQDSAAVIGTARCAATTG